MSELRTKPISTRSSPERRSSARQKMVLRVGLLQAAGRTSFCLVRNISASGVQVRLYGNLAAGCDISLTVGDESPLHGRLKWVREDLAGIEFNETLAPTSLLRVTQKLSGSRRRSSPRTAAAAPVVVTTNGRTVAAELCDISTSGARIRTRRPINPELQRASSESAGCRRSGRSSAGATKRSLASPSLPRIPIQIIAGWLGERTLVSR